MKLPQKIKLGSLLLALTIGVNLLPISVCADSVSLSDKISPQLQQAMEEAAPGEKLPVILWTQDIDHEQIARQVEIRTGLTIDNIQLDTKKDLNLSKLDMSFAETNDLAKANEQVSIALEETKAVRKQKQVLADTYVAQKRSAYTAEYRSQNAKKLQALNVAQDDVVFQSEYSPLMVVDMSAEEIRKAARSAAVLSLDLSQDAVVQDDSLASSMQTIKADYTASVLTGSDVKVGQIETYVPDIYDNFLDGKVTVISGQSNWHATNVAHFLHAMVPDAQIYSIGLGGDASLANFCNKVEQLINRGVSVINMSMSFTTPDKQRVPSADPWYSPYEQWVDHISGTHEVTFVVAAGNEGNGVAVSIPGLAHNVITVGAVDDNQTGAKLTDDWLYNGSCSGNGDQDGCAKPDVLASGTIAGYNAAGVFTTDTATSYAAPIIAGLAAQMMDFDSSLKSRARPVKAILSACCDRKVPSTRGVVETMEEGLTAEQGAGVVNATRMSVILLNETYMSGNFTSDDFKTQISLRAPINVSATWIRENGVSNHTSGSVGVSAYQNLDLYLYSPTGQQLDSRLNMSSTEMVYRNSATPGVYTVQLYKRDGNTNRTIWFALAWYSV